MVGWIDFACRRRHYHHGHGRPGPFSTGGITSVSTAIATERRMLRGSALVELDRWNTQSSS